MKKEELMIYLRRGIVDAAKQYVLFEEMSENDREFLKISIDKMGKDAERFRESAEFDELVSEIESVNFKDWLPDNKKDDELLGKFIKDFVTEVICKIAETEGVQA